MLPTYDGGCLGESCPYLNHKGDSMAKAHIKRLQRAAARVSMLNELIDSGDHAAGKAKRMMQGSWVKRNSTNTYGFFDQKKAREIKRGAV